MANKTTTYCSCEANGPEGAERIANMYRSDNTIVTVEHDKIPQWDGGGMERGYRITVTKKDAPPKKRIIGW